MEEATKTYTLRNLEAKDVSLMAKIISSIGIKEFKTLFTDETIAKLTQEGASNAVENIIEAVGLEMFIAASGIILENLPNCERHLFTFLSNLSGMEVSEIESMPLDQFAEMLVDILQKKEFKSFIKVVSKLFK